MKPVPGRGINLNFGAGLRESLRAGITRETLRADILAGITVGIVAVPLAMALAIASGVPPQHGLYTAIVGGAIIALLGGSRLSVSGPTAAFVVILQPIAAQYGVGGLLLSTMMAGVILLLMGMGRMGRLIQYIPYPVTTGFTAGIAVVIATLQIKDFLGLNVSEMPEQYLERVIALAGALPTAHWPDILIGTLTLGVLVYWPRLRIPVPGHLVALLAGASAAWLLGQSIDGFQLATIGSRFEYELDGMFGQGIPPLPPMPVLPWELPGADGRPLELSLDLVESLIGPAFAIAILGAIESLLCAVVVDGLAGTRHDPDSELLGQGIGNILVPFFGGIAATGAIARSATNFRAGGRTPIASVVHAVLILAAVISLAPLLAHLPMASLAALLLVVAWNMSEARHFVHILKVAPREDILVLLACFGLTVVFDMVIAVGVGVVLAAFLFMGRMAEITNARKLEADHPRLDVSLPESVQVYEIAGPMFFGAAEKAISSLEHIGKHVDIVVLEMGGVPVMDVTGLVALDSILGKLNGHGVCVVLAGVQKQPARLMRRAGIRGEEGKIVICGSLDAAVQRVRERLSVAGTGTKRDNKDQ